MPMSTVYAIIVDEILQNGKAIIAMPPKKLQSRIRAGLSEERKKREQVYNVFGGKNPFEGMRFNYKQEEHDDNIMTISLVPEEKLELHIFRKVT